MARSQIGDRRRVGRSVLGGRASAAGEDDHGHDDDARQHRGEHDCTFAPRRAPGPAASGAVAGYRRADGCSSAAAATLPACGGGRRRCRGGIRGRGLAAPARTALRRRSGRQPRGSPAGRRRSVGWRARGDGPGAGDACSACPRDRARRGRPYRRAGGDGGTRGGRHRCPRRRAGATCGRGGRRGRAGRSRRERFGADLGRRRRLRGVAGGGT